MLLKNCEEYTLDLDIYIHVSGTRNTIRKGNLNNCTLSNTPPQARAYMLYAPSLLQMYLGPLRDLVKISVSWSFELTKLVITHPNAIFSLMKWQSTSMCLVLSWKTKLDAICKAAWLSQMSFHLFILSKSQLSKKMFQIYEFTCCQSHSSILSFSTKSGHYILFLTLPGY